MGKDKYLIQLATLWCDPSHLDFVHAVPGVEPADTLQIPSDVERRGVPRQIQTLLLLGIWGYTPGDWRERVWDTKNFNILYVASKQSLTLALLSFARTCSFWMGEAAGGQKMQQQDEESKFSLRRLHVDYGRKPVWDSGMANRLFFFNDLATPILPETRSTSVGGGGKTGGLNVRKKTHIIPGFPLHKSKRPADKPANSRCRCSISSSNYPPSLIPEEQAGGRRGWMHVGSEPFRSPGTKCRVPGSLI